MRGRAPSPFHGAPKSSRLERGGTLLPTGLRHFSALVVSPSLSVALRLAGRWGPRTPSSLRLAPGDLPKIGSNVAYASFSTVS